MPGNARGNGFDLSELNELISKVEQLGANMAKVSQRILDAGSEPARRAFIRNMPPNSKKDKKHARDNVTVTKTRTSRRGTRYRLIGAHGEEFRYLWYVENGHSKAPAHPFVERAYRDASNAASEPMREAAVNEIENHLR